MKRKLKKILLLILGLVIVIGIFTVVITSMMFKKETVILNIDASEDYILKESYGEKARTTKLYVQLMTEGKVSLLLRDKWGEVILEKQVVDELSCEYRSEGDVSIELLSDEEIQLKVIKELKFDLW
ncbi:MAG: hypothetical protein GX237_03405 [Clostridiales bacterium]|nr:hypothetical protein [Clostridiales bacterium]